MEGSLGVWTVSRAMAMARAEVMAMAMAMAIAMAIAMAMGCSCCGGQSISQWYKLSINNLLWGLSLMGILDNLVLVFQFFFLV